MMYDRQSPPGYEGRVWADKKIEELEKKYPEEAEFWEYMKK